MLLATKGSFLPDYGDARVVTRTRTTPPPHRGSLVAHPLRVRQCPGLISTCISPLTHGIGVVQDPRQRIRPETEHGSFPGFEVDDKVDGRLQGCLDDVWADFGLVFQGVECDRCAEAFFDARSDQKHRHLTHGCGVLVVVVAGVNDNKEGAK